MASADEEEECSRQLEQQHGSFVSRAMPLFVGQTYHHDRPNGGLLDWRCRPEWCRCLWTWLGCIVPGITLNQHHPAVVGLVCDPPRLANSTFLSRRLTMGSKVSLSMDQLSGTAYVLNFSHLTSRCTFSKPEWRHFCLTADWAHLHVFYSNFALYKCP